MTEPESEYRLRRGRWEAERTLSQRRFVVAGNWRLAFALLFAALAYLAFGAHRIRPAVLLIPASIFAGLAYYGAKTARRRTLADRALKFYDQGLARLGDRWSGTGERGERFRDPQHVYAEDLDLFGKGSLFELACRARTAAGESVLASWLSEPALLPEAVARQDAVKELKDMLNLREDLALLGEDIRAEVDLATISRWAEQPALRVTKAMRVAAFVLAAAGTLALIGFLALWLPLWPLAAVLACEFAFSRVLRSRIRKIVAGVDTPATGLRIMSLLLARLCEASFHSERLRHLHSELNVQGIDAARRIARLQRWVEMLDSSDNLLVRAIQPLVLWREQAAMGVERWRQANGAFVGRWIAGVAEIEGLSSLASVAYEHSGWTFPELVDGDIALFDADDLRHALIPEAKCVPNSIKLDNRAPLLIVSGSNMSGKSTLLRAAGLATAMAWAGAPVPARSLRISRLQTAASVRVNDSLQDNRSRFFAEISRIREIVDRASKTPTLFLLDELLSGTNSHDRKIGAYAIVRKLVDSGAVGLITTHDLALAGIEDNLPGLARNVHFDDYIANGKIEFEFKLKPGVVTHSNALELMRSIGLNV